MPQCRKLRPIRRFIPTALRRRVRRVLRSSLTARLHHLRACLTTARHPAPSLGRDARKTRLRQPTSPALRPKPMIARHHRLQTMAPRRKRPTRARGDTNGEDNTPSDGIKATLSAVVTEGTSGTEEGKPTVDKKPTVTAHPEDPTAAQSADSGQTATAADAFAGSVTAPASPVTPSLDQVGPKEPEGDTSLAVRRTPQLSALAPSPLKIAGKQIDPVKQSDTEQPVEAEQVRAKLLAIHSLPEKRGAVPYRQIANCCRRE